MTPRVAILPTMPTEAPMLTYFVATTVDGKIALDDGSHPGFAMEGSSVDAFQARLADYDAVLMGRKTYEVGLAAGLPLGDAAYPGMENYVVSTTLVFPQGSAAHLVDDDPVRVARSLLDAGQRVWICGGAILASALLAARLVERVIVKVNPVLYGGGIPLARALPERVELTLVDTEVFDTGVVFLEYRTR